MRTRPTESLPLAIAHRAGNHLERLRPAADAGADVIEADVWFRRGNLEVRHLKTLGPLPVLWDRWKLAPGWTRRLVLEDLLEVWPDGPELMVDMKGEDSRFPSALAKSLERHHAGRPVTFSGRNWDLLDPLAGYPDARFFPSCGYQEQIGQLLARFRDHFDVAVLHAPLVTKENVHTIQESGAEVITWPINTRAELDRVVEAGASGVICDDLGMIQHLAAERARRKSSEGR